MEEKMLYLTNKELVKLDSALIWRIIEEEEWVARTQGSEDPIEQRIYNGCKDALEILNGLRDKVRNAILK